MSEKMARLSSSVLLEGFDVNETSFKGYAIEKESESSDDVFKDNEKPVKKQKSFRTRSSSVRHMSLAKADLLPY